MPRRISAFRVRTSFIFSRWIERGDALCALEMQIANSYICYIYSHINRALSQEERKARYYEPQFPCQCALIPSKIKRSRVSASFINLSVNLLVVSRATFRFLSLRDRHLNGLLLARYALNFSEINASLGGVKTRDTAWLRGRIKRNASAREAAGTRVK